MEGSEVIIEAKELTKVFNGLTAVDHVNFKVQRGEIFGFLGPNGAGKTTTINMLITLMKPTYGEAWVAGFNVVEEPHEVRKRVGIVFQDSTVDGRLTGWENLWIHGRMYGMGRDELRERIEWALEFVELQKWGDVVVKKYSGGMVRRLEIARALLCQPEVLFLDEPTLGLDPQTRAHIWDYVEELRREESLTVFLTTHYMDEADRLCDRVAIIDRGRIIASGTPEELKRSLGVGVVYLKFVNEEDATVFLRTLKETGFVDDVRMIGKESIAVSTKDAPSVIPTLFREASNLGLAVAEVSYRMPTLDDVFLNLTGRGLRESETGEFGALRLRMMRMGRR